MTPDFAEEAWGRNQEGTGLIHQDAIAAKTAFVVDQAAAEIHYPRHGRMIRADDFEFFPLLREPLKQHLRQGAALRFRVVSILPRITAPEKRAHPRCIFAR
jgi:hypothetical protein